MRKIGDDSESTTPSPVEEAKWAQDVKQGGSRDAESQVPLQHSLYVNPLFWYVARIPYFSSGFEETTTSQQD